MNFTDLLYDNFIGVFSNLWYHRVLFIATIFLYFYTDVHNRFFETKVDVEPESKREKEWKEMDIGSLRCCETKEESEEENQYSSDFISESDSESEKETNSEQKSLIKKHFKILTDIQNTKFKTDDYSCSYHYYCVNENIKLECCFCKICGDYICSSDSPSKKIMCTHYKLIDSVDSRIGIFSGHIRIDDEKDAQETINSFFETSDELEMQYYKNRLMQFVNDEAE
jgi:hypothetical protein